MPFPSTPSETGAPMQVYRRSWGFPVDPFEPFESIADRILAYLYIIEHIAIPGIVGDEELQPLDEEPDGDLDPITNLRQAIEFLTGQVLLVRNWNCLHAADVYEYFSALGSLLFQTTYIMLLFSVANQWAPQRHHLDPNSKLNASLETMTELMDKARLNLNERIVRVPVGTFPDHQNRWYVDAQYLMSANEKVLAATGLQLELFVDLEEHLRMTNGKCHTPSSASLSTHSLTVL